MLNKVINCLSLRDLHIRISVIDFFQQPAIYKKQDHIGCIKKFYLPSYLKTYETQASGRFSKFNLLTLVA